MFRKILSAVLLMAVLSGCVAAKGNLNTTLQGNTSVKAVIQPILYRQPSIPVQAPDARPAPGSTTGDPTVNSAGSTGSSSKAPAPAAQSVAVTTLGPDHFPDGINPLTGLPVQNSANLALSPALVSVTNFPVTARPQAGLSFSPFVFEMYIGEGMTRFLALFYGNYPQKSQSNGIALADDRVGPIRSGRLPYESLRKLYNGFLVMASGSSMVLPSLNSYTNVFGTDTNDINSAMIPASKLETIASKNPDRLQKDALTGLKFSTSVPESGQMANKIWIPFSFLNQVIWKYDPASGAYARYQDNADGKTFIQATDRLNQQPLAYSNVVVLFADHVARAETLIDINLMYITKMPALLFRDGKMYQIYWTTANSDYEKRTGLIRPIRFIDAQGNAFPLKPGQTWVEMVQQGTRYNEAPDTQSYFDLKTKTETGSGVWAIQFYPTVAEKK